jgi:hypothetical protein
MGQTGCNRAPFRVYAGVVATLASAALVLGCMGGLSRPIAVAPPAPEEPLLTQRGKVAVPDDVVVEVFYPWPYLSPPNLTLEGSFPSLFIIEEQKADHFKVKKNGHWTGPSEVFWCARGLRTPVPSPSTPPPSVVAPPGLPPEPIPVPTP